MSIGCAHTIHARDAHFHWNNKNAPVKTVAPGDTIEFDVIDSSGGAITHIRGILAASNPRDHGVREVHVWSYRKLLDSLPDAKWLVRHHDEALEGRLVP